MFEWIKEFYSNEVFLFFFWGPVIINGVVYPIHVWARVQKDRATLESWKKDFAEAEHENKSTYRPSLHDYDFVSVGSLFKYLFLTITPVINALACIFHVAPIAWDYLTDRFAWLFSIKLVSKND